MRGSCLARMPGVEICDGLESKARVRVGLGVQDVRRRHGANFRPTNGLCQDLLVGKPIGFASKRRRQRQYRDHDNDGLRCMPWRLSISVPGPYRSATALPACSRAYAPTQLQQGSGPPDMKKWNRGVVWRNDKLYVFEPTSVLVMRLWPEMRAWRRTSTRPWLPTRKWADRAFLTQDAGQDLSGFLRGWSDHKAHFIGPLFEVAYKDHRFQALSSPPLKEWTWYPFVSERLCGTLEHAFATIPLREQQIAGRLVERRWHSLALMARCPGAADLLEANPALGFALASNWVFHVPAVTQPLRAARALVKKKQVAILDWLGFPATERVRRILTRITPEALEIRRLLHLQWALQETRTQDLLGHLPRITTDILRFVCCQDTRRRLMPRFLHQLSDESVPCLHDRYGNAGLPRDARYYELWMDASRMARDLDRSLPRWLHSIAQLHCWHDELVAELNDANRTNTAALRNNIAQAIFGPAPFSGTLDIKPVQSGKELLAEGATMNNCVASYYRLVLDGGYFVYRVMAPVRATVGIVRHSRGWEIDQIKGPGNLSIPAAYRDAIRMQLFDRACIG